MHGAVRSTHRRHRPEKVSFVCFAMVGLIVARHEWSLVIRQHHVVWNIL